VAAILDTATNLDFINTLQANSRVEIQEQLFDVSFEFPTGRTLILSPDRFSEESFRGFMGIMSVAGFAGMEMSHTIAHQVRASLANEALNPLAAMNGWAHEIVTVQFQIQGPRGARWSHPVAFFPDLPRGPLGGSDDENGLGRILSRVWENRHIHR